MSFSLMIQHRDAGQQKCKDRKYDEAGQLFNLALKEAQSVSPPNVYEAQQLKTLGVFHFAFGRFEEAEPLMKRSLEIERSLLGGEDLEICKSLNHLGLLYHIHGDYSKAEQFYKQSLSIISKAPYQKKPSVDAKLHHLTLHLLAMVHCAEGKQNDAFELCKQAAEKVCNHTGPGGKDLSMDLHDVTVKYCDNDPDPEVRKTCGWLLNVFFGQLQTEFLGSVIECEDMNTRDIQPKKAAFASSHEVLATYDEAWRPSAIYRNDRLPEGFIKTQDRSRSERRYDDRLAELNEEEWRP